MTARSPFKEGQFEAQGVPIRYFEAGQGDAIIAVDSLTWGLPTLYQSLADRYRVVVLEIPLSAGEAGSPSAHDLSTTMSRVSASLASGPYTLVGTSTGANVALWQALNAPDGIEAVVLVSPTAILPSEGQAVGSSPVELLVAHAENAAGLPEPAAATGVADLIRRIRAFPHDTEAENRLGEIQCPVLAVFGVEDKMISPEAARVYRAKIPNCNISLVYDAGHVIEADRPGALTNLVSDFVERRETFIVGRESTVINP